MWHLRGLLKVDFDNNILSAYGVLLMRLMCFFQVHLNEGPIELGIRPLIVNRISPACYGLAQ